MKLRKYLLNESQSATISCDPDVIKDILWDECSQILKGYKRTGEFLYRGIGILPSHRKCLFLKYKQRFRIPKDTPEDIHDKLNYLFRKKFGWKVRNGIFATGSASDAKGYGAPVYFFPINGYRFCWSPKYRDIFNDVVEELLLFDEHEFTDDILADVVNSYTNKNLLKAIRSYNEISFNVEQYYVISHKHKALVKYIIGN